MQEFRKGLEKARQRQTFQAREEREAETYYKLQAAKYWARTGLQAGIAIGGVLFLMSLGAGETDHNAWPDQSHDQHSEFRGQSGRSITGAELPAVSADEAAATEAAYCTHLAGPVRHKVMPGESLEAIAHTYGTTVEELTWINNIKSDSGTALEGSCLFIPQQTESE